MKKSISFVFLLLCFFIQAQKKHTFNIELNHFSNSPVFTLSNGFLSYVGSDLVEKNFYSNYQILKFYQTYPSSNRLVNLNIFTFETYSSQLMNDLLVTFPSKFLRIENLTDLKFELANFYPNDYGITNPNVSGYFADQKHLDYMGTPKAWDINTGTPSTIIGISDARIEKNDIDFANKVATTSTYLANATNITNPNSIEFWHGTNSAGYAAGRGDNNHGGVGVCYNCNIIAGWYLDLNTILEMAQNGAKVINMSWATSSLIPSWQNVINEIYEDYNVVLVASSGNVNPFQKWPQGSSTGNYYYPNGNLLYYPASFNNVISVMSVNHYNNLYESYGIDTSEPNPVYAAMPMSFYVKDNISPRIIPNFNNSGINLAMTDRLDDTHTHNDKVDICAPAWNVMSYDKLLLGQNVSGGGTSTSAPLVSGTLGLMYSVNPCIINSEAETILKLTAKNLEIVNGNQPFFGRIGAGKVESGDAVEFASEMKKINGNAVIDGQDFWRFNFDLKNINNQLTISNQSFRDQNNSNFIAKKEIRLLPGTSIKPNSAGSFHIGINSNINIVCSSSGLSKKHTNAATQSTKIIAPASEFVLYPNPNNGYFTLRNIDFSVFNSNHIEIDILDLNGRILFNDKIIGNEKKEFLINLENKLSQGIYVLNLYTNDYKISQKFIVND